MRGAAGGGAQALELFKGELYDAALQGFAPDELHGIVGCVAGGVWGAVVVVGRCRALLLILEVGLLVFDGFVPGFNLCLQAG